MSSAKLGKRFTVLELGQHDFGRRPHKVKPKSQRWNVFESFGKVLFNLLLGIQVWQSLDRKRFQRLQDRLFDWSQLSCCRILCSSVQGASPLGSLKKNNAISYLS